MDVSYRIERNWGTADSPEWDESYWLGGEPTSDEEAIGKLKGLPNKYRVTRVETTVMETVILPLSGIGMSEQKRTADAVEADQANGKLADIRAVLARFNWGEDDLQYALEQIDQIANGD